MIIGTQGKFKASKIPWTCIKSVDSDSVEVKMDTVPVTIETFKVRDLEAASDITTIPAAITSSNADAPSNTSTQKAYDDMTEQERMDILHELMQCSVC